ncbi:MAG: hypothetical protein ACYTEE_09035 [Planctomycetota bacterium]|jgi:hypothetical protein
MRKEALFFSAIILMTIIAPRAVSGVTTIKTNTTIDSSDKWYGWDDRVEIRSNPTVNMIGGHADFIHTYNTSTLNKSGGKILRFRSYDSSVLNISDGGYISVFAVAWNSSSVNMTGGEIKKLIGRSSSMIQISNGLIGELSIRDNSEAQIDGGTIQYIDSQGNGVVNIIDGDIGNMKTVTQYGEGGLIGPGYINIIGGQVDGLYGEDFGEIEVTGGDITELGTRDMAVANIFGGSISHAFVEPDGVINIFGGNIDALVWNEPIIPSSLTLSAESESSIGGQIYIYGKSLYSTHVGGLYGYGYG